MCEASPIDPRREIVYRMGVLVVAIIFVLHLSGSASDVASTAGAARSIRGVTESLAQQLGSPRNLHAKGWPMNLSFARSGGFAGPATEVRGLITFSAANAEVTVPGTAYRRTLASEEAGALVAWEKSVRPLASHGESNSMRDAFQYTASVTQSEGKPHELNLGGSDSASTQLLQWVQAETQRIWEFRLANRPSP